MKPIFLVFTSQWLLVATSPLSIFDIKPLLQQRQGVPALPCQRTTDCHDRCPISESVICKDINPSNNTGHCGCVDAASAPSGLNWGAVGDSWTSGVAYSAKTVYSKTDREYCYRTNEAWGAQMENDMDNWVDGPGKFYFAGCGGTKMDDIKRQLGKIGDSRLAIGTIGGNNGYFGDIARACIYKPAPGPWGPDYDNDQKGEGWCKKNLKKARTYIDGSDGSLKDDFSDVIGQVFEWRQNQDDGTNAGDRDFNFFASSYVEFFDATTDDCDKWTFARWFSTGSPKLVKDLRAEMNELVSKFNGVQADVIKGYKTPKDNFHVTQIPISDEFKGHRFCEKGHTFENQWTSADVWIWNLQWNNGETSEDGQTGLSQQNKEGVMVRNKPDGAPDGPLPLMSLDTNDRNDQDQLLFKAGNATAESQSGFGWTARPFHPKPRGHEAMKKAFIQKFRDAKVPGVKG